MTKIINMTPHACHIIDENGKIIKTFEPSGNLVRLSTSTEVVEDLGGLPLTKTVYGEPQGLPAFQEGTYYIVSAMIKSALPGRTDLLVPAEQVRDDAGRVIGCRSFGI